MNLEVVLRGDVRHTVQAHNLFARARRGAALLRGARRSLRQHVGAVGLQFK